MVVVATQDRFHYEPALALLDRGYHLLLEKPLATTLEHCDGIVEAAELAGATFAVCHGMRYAPYRLTRVRTGPRSCCWPSACTTSSGLVM
jgi:predicted dehydrogenase